MWKIINSNICVGKAGNADGGNELSNTLWQILPQLMYKITSTQPQVQPPVVCLAKYREKT